MPRRRAAVEYQSSRAVPALRQALGERIRTLRKERSLSQDRLGAMAGLTGKFIGEVERGQKSISLDSLYHIATALGLTLRAVMDMPVAKRGTPPHKEAMEVWKLLARNHHHPADLQKAYRALRAALR